MRKVFLMLSVSLFSLNAEAATQECIDAPDCTELGYTQTEADCPNGAVKCPWNTGLVFCGCGEDYQYTCDGANEIAGNNKCGDYYASCGCDSGYKWEDGKCVLTCKIGDIYYTDKTCSSADDYDSSKTVLGIVVHAYVKSNGVGGQIMAPWPIDKDGNKNISNNKTMVWSDIYFDIPNLPNDIGSSDYDSCGNTDKIVAAGSANTYPAAWATRKYAPTTETAGKWCLPAAGIMVNIYKNKIAIQYALTKVGGVEFPNEGVWTSSELSASFAFYSDFKLNGGLFHSLDKKHWFYVRPILEF